MFRAYLIPKLNSLALWTLEHTLVLSKSAINYIIKLYLGTYTA